MGIIATAVKHLLAAGIVGDQLIAAIEELEDRHEPLRVTSQVTSGALRMRRWRARNKASHGDESDGSDVTVTQSCNDSTYSDGSEKVSIQQDGVTKASRVTRGFRLPDGWQPHPNILELARSRGLSDAEYADHLERFRDYWNGVSGQRGVKLDWDATWRNRIKEIADRKRTYGGGARQSTPGDRMRDALDRVGEQVGRHGHGKGSGTLL